LSLVLLAASAAMAQAPSQGTGYTPREGQPGKDVIWLPTQDPVVDVMLNLAQVTAQDYVIDLGSGDGRLVIAAAKRGARSLGIEYDPGLVELAKRNADRAGVAETAQFVKADIFASDFSQASVITMFLLPELNLKLRPQILQLRPGTRIVSNTFPMGDWQPDETVDVEKECVTHCTGLLWIVPATVDGAWKLGTGQLALTQTFQTFSGTYRVAGKQIEIRDGKLRGDQVSFALEDAVYTGRVLGGRMEGGFTSPRGTGAWSAVHDGPRP
jgi:SAM-dependent methyltransferase